MVLFGWSHALFSWDALAPKMVMSLRTRLTIGNFTFSAIAFMAFSKNISSLPPHPHALKKPLFFHMDEIQPVSLRKWHSVQRLRSGPSFPHMGS